MKKFIFKISVFGFIFFFLNLIFYICFANIVFYKKYINPLNELKKSHATILILGDSHSAVMDQSLFPKDFINLSFASDSLIDIYFKLNFILKKNKKIDTLLITADNHIFSKYRAEYNNLERSIIFSDYATYNQIIPISFMGYCYKKYVNRYLPLSNNVISNIFKSVLFRRISKIGQLFNKVKDSDQSLSWAEMSEMERIEGAQSRASGQISNEYDEKLFFAYEKIIELCEEYEILIIGITYPLTFEYLQAIENADVSVVDDFFKQRNIEIYDFSKGVVTKTEHFEDHDHVNDDGAKIFINALKEKLAKDGRN